jgi:hypothetical protein
MTRARSLLSSRLPAVFSLALWALTGAASSKQDSATDQKENGRQQSGEPVDDIVRTIDGINYLVVRGEIVMPDGSVPTNLKAWARYSDSRPLPDNLFTLAGNRFELLVFGNYVQILAHTSDHSHRVFHFLNEQQLAEARRAGSIRIELRPTRLFPVKVLDENGFPAPDVRVNHAGGAFPASVTDANGIATCHLLPAEENDARFSARKGDRRALRLVPANLLEPFGPDRPIELRLVRDPVERIRFVDEAGSPVAGFSLGSGSGLVHAATDENGFYERFLGGRYDFISDDDREWRQVGVRPGEDFTTVVIARKVPRVRIRGTCQPAELAVPGALVELKQTNRGSDTWARINANGEFTADIVPGREYTVQVSEPEMQSDRFQGVLADNDGRIVATPLLTVEQGIRVRLLVTQGDKQTPLADKTVSLFFDRPEDRWVRLATDSQGLAHLNVHPETRIVDVHFESKNAQAAVQNQAAENEVVDVNFPDPAPGTTYKIQLKSAAGDSNALAHARIQVLDQNNVAIAEGTSDAAGTFEFETGESSFALVASSRDGKLAAIAKICPPRFPRPPVIAAEKNSPDPVEMVLQEVVTYRGKLVDGDDNPVAGQELTVGAFQVFDDPTLTGVPAWHIPKTLVFYKPVLTDSDGRFVVEGIPAGASVDLYRGPNTHFYLCKNVDLAAASGKVDLIRFWPVEQGAMAISYREHGLDLDAALGMARGGRTSVLVACYTPNPFTPGFLDSGLFNVWRLPETGDYVPFVVNRAIPPGSWQGLAARLALKPADSFSAWQIPPTDIELILLEPDGTVQRRKTFWATDEDILDQIRAFLGEQDK